MIKIQKLSVLKTLFVSSLMIAVASEKRSEKEKGHWPNQPSYREQCNTCFPPM